jgi:Flp pilus assembly pilin Flp
VRTTVSRDAAPIGAVFRFGTPVTKTKRRFRLRMCGTGPDRRPRARAAAAPRMLELKRREQRHLTTKQRLAPVSWHTGCASGCRHRGHAGERGRKWDTQAAFRTERAGGTTMNLITRLRKLLRNDSGQDLLEYALLVALIALVAVAAITSTGTKASDIFNAISNKLVTPP